MLKQISKRQIQKAVFSVPLVLIVLLAIFCLTIWLELWICIEFGIFRLLGNIWMILLLFFGIFTLPLFVTLCLAPCVFVIIAPKVVNPPENVEASLRTIARKSGAKVRWIAFIDNPFVNAACTGMGWPGYGVFFFRGLTKKLSEAELIAVGAHEVGHAQLNHTVKNLLNIIFIVGAAIFLSISSMFLIVVLTHDTLLQLAAMMIIFLATLATLFLIFKRVNRRRELEADIFAKKQGKGSALASALRKISPKKTTWFGRLMSIFDSHPTLKEREVALKQWGG